MVNDMKHPRNPTYQYKRINDLDTNKGQKIQNNPDHRPYLKPHEWLGNDIFWAISRHQSSGSLKFMVHGHVIRAVKIQSSVIEWSEWEFVGFCLPSPFRNLISIHP